MNKRYQLILCWRHACERSASALRILADFEKQYPNAFDYVRLNNLENVNFIVNRHVNDYPTWIIQDGDKEVKRAQAASSLENIKYWLKDYLK